MSAFEFLEHLPYSPGPEAKSTGRLQGFGTPGETVAFSFSIRCTEDRAEVVLSAPLLKSEETTIDSSHIELYIVKLWDVSGVGIHQCGRMTAGELLVKDDRAPLNDGYLEHPDQGVGSIRPLWRYNPPNVRLAGDANTSLAAGEPKQIWLSVQIPQGTPAASYTGCLEIRGSLGDAHLLPVELTVLPFTLLEPAQDLMLWYRGSMDPQQSQFYVSPELYRIHLQDIYDHGFRSISVNERDRARAQLAIDIAEEIGFNRHVVFRLVPENAAALRFGKLKPVYYLSDEMDAQMLSLERLRESHISQHRAHGAYCGYLKWRSMSSLISHRFVERMEDNEDVGFKPTVINLFLPSNRKFFALNGARSALERCLIYYYWQSHMEKPNLHRALAGLYLWKTGADGIAPYCYQHPPVFPFSPFDDFDAWEPGCRDEVLAGPYLWETGADGIAPYRHQHPPVFPFSPSDEFKESGPGLRAGLLRDQMTTYPAQLGIIPTLQWEGLREGIIDLRYLTTLEHALSLVDAVASEEAKSLAAEARHRRNSILSCISIEDIDIESETDTEPYPNIAPHQFQDFRRQVAEDIIRLYTHVCRQPKPPPARDTVSGVRNKAS